MSSNEACCTCATLLSSLPPSYDEKTEKPSPIHERRLGCCGRAICPRCVTDNPRFATYCPFCQVSTALSALPQGLRDPPPYEEADRRSRGNDTNGVHREENEELPSYNSLDARPVEDEKSQSGNDAAPDVLHFVNPDQDSIPTLAIRYGVPINALRRTNGLFSDNLLAARRTILIPGEFYKGGVSLSPRPVEGEEEEIRKGKVRKWMVACKVAEYEPPFSLPGVFVPHLFEESLANVRSLAPRYRYDVALMYLKQSEYNLDEAIQAYKEDERWEKEHPLTAGKKGKAAQSIGRRKWAGGMGMTAQMG